MKTLYILLHIGTFIMGWLDNGDITVFAMLIVIDICILWDKLFGPSKTFERILGYIRKWERCYLK